MGIPALSGYMCGHTFGDSQGKASGNHAGWFPESWRTDLGIPEESGGGGVSAGAVAIASVGINI